MVDYRRAFAAVRSDPRWKGKIALGALIALIPYLGAIWMLGWELDYERNVAWGQDERLPSWKDFERHAKLGLSGFVVSLAYSLALSVVVVPLAVLIYVPWVLTAVTGDAFPGPGFAAGIVAWALGLTVITLLALPFTASALLRVSLYGSIESGFQVKEIWRLMREYRSELLRAWGYTLLNWLLTLIAMAVVFALLFGIVALLVVGVAALSKDSPPGLLAVQIVAVFGLGTLAYVGSLFFTQVLGFYLGLVSMHYFGSYGRAAYHLDEARTSWDASATGDVAVGTQDASSTR